MPFPHISQGKGVLLGRGRVVEKQDRIFDALIFANFVWAVSVRVVCFSRIVRYDV